MIAIFLLLFPPFLIPDYAIGFATIFDVFAFLYLITLILIREKTEFKATHLFFFLVPPVYIIFNFIVANYEYGMRDLAVECLRWLYFASCAFLIYLLCIRDQEFAKNIYSAFYFSSIMLSLIFWIIWSLNPRYIFGFPLLAVEYEEASIIVGRNFVGFISVLGFVNGLVYAFGSNGRLALNILPLSLLLLTLIFSFSKGGWVTLFCCLIYISFSLRKFLYIAVSFLITIFLTTSDYFLLKMQLSKFTLEQRFIYQLQTVDLLAINPFVGFGPGNYADASIRYGMLGTSDPHSVWAQLLSEYGLLGTSFFICCFVFWYLNFTKKRLAWPVVTKRSRIDQRFTLTLLALFVTSFVSGLPFSSEYFWIVLGSSYSFGHLGHGKTTV